MLAIHEGWDFGPDPSDEARCRPPCCVRCSLTLMAQSRRTTAKVAASTESAPASRTTAAARRSDEPVVITSSTSTTRGGDGRAVPMSGPTSLAERFPPRCARPRRRSKRTSGVSSRVATIEARTRPWSKPLVRRCPGLAGTQVTASTESPSPATHAASAIRPPICRRTSRRPAFFAATIRRPTSSS